jgi:hypothetical protein
VCKTTMLVLLFTVFFNPSQNGYSIKAQTELALLTQTNGKITVKRGSRTLRVRESTLLNARDLVTIEGDGAAVIYQAYALTDRLGRNDSRTIRVLAPPPPPNGLELDQFLILKRNYLNAKNRRRVPSPRTMGGPEDSLTLQEPRNSAVLDSRPTFKWNSISNVTDYTIAIYASDESPVWTTRTKESIVRFPDSLPGLITGTYKWEVIAHREGTPLDTSVYDASSFSVLSKEDTMRINLNLEALRRITNASPANTNIVVITALLENKLYSQAYIELRRALELSPTDQSLWDLLMETFFQMKLWGSRENARQISTSISPDRPIQSAFEFRR